MLNASASSGMVMVLLFLSIVMITSELFPEPFPELFPELFTAVFFEEISPCNFSI